MKERPIIFSGPMVRAILDDRKTQTRRVLKPQPAGLFCGPEVYTPLKVRKNGQEYDGDPVFGIYCPDGEWGTVCPYGQPGDRLWVRETALFWNSKSGPTKVAAYKSDGYELEHGERWTSPIHMPRWASRITLEIVSVRVERLQDITDADIRAEGIEPDRASNHPRGVYYTSLMASWQSIHGLESWYANPWVWVVDFRRITT